MLIYSLNEPLIVQNQLNPQFGYYCLSHKYWDFAWIAISIERFEGLYPWIQFPGLY